VKGEKRPPRALLFGKADQGPPKNLQEANPAKGYGNRRQTG